MLARRAPKRAYRMVARATASGRTVERIHAAAVALFGSRPFAEVTLQAVADASGVTLQTILRRFGSKERLFQSAAEAATAAIMSSRELPAGADTAAIVATLAASYEAIEGLGWRGLTQEDQFPWLKERLDLARRLHRQWVERAFAGALGPARGPERERRVLLLFGATDFYLWKLYRRDLGLGRAATIARMTEHVTALVRAFERRA